MAKRPLSALNLRDQLPGSESADLPIHVRIMDTSGYDHMATIDHVMVEAEGLIIILNQEM